jgi:hypothetical protein
VTKNTDAMSLERPFYEIESEGDRALGEEVRRAEQAKGNCESCPIDALRRGGKSGKLGG